MTISVVDIYRVGQHLGTLHDEGSHRSAVSRLYYAAYHCADNWYRALPEPGSQGSGPVGGMHQQLINAMHNPGPGIRPEAKAASRKAAVMLQILHSHRITADYKLTEASMTSIDVENQREQVARLCAMLGTEVNT